MRVYIFVSEAQSEVVHKLWDWAKAQGAQFSWGTASIYGTFGPSFPELFNRSAVTLKNTLVSIAISIGIRSHQIRIFPELSLSWAIFSRLLRSRTYPFVNIGLLFNVLA